MTSRDRYFGIFDIIGISGSRESRDPFGIPNPEMGFQDPEMRIFQSFRNIFFRMPCPIKIVNRETAVTALIAARQRGGLSGHKISTRPYSFYYPVFIIPLTKDTPTDRSLAVCSVRLHTMFAVFSFCVVFLLGVIALCFCFVLPLCALTLCF